MSQITETNVLVLTVYASSGIGAAMLLMTPQMHETAPTSKRVRTQFIRYFLTFIGMLYLGSPSLVLTYMVHGRAIGINAYDWMELSPLAGLMALCTLVALISPILALASAIYIYRNPVTMGRRIFRAANTKTIPESGWASTEDMRQLGLRRFFTRMSVPVWFKDSTQYDGHDASSCFVRSDPIRYIYI